MTASAGVSGWVAAGFEGVVEAFEANLDQRGELGAAFAACVRGQPVVDLWGGLADAEGGERWRADTLQLLFSGTKGIVAICLLMLVERGMLDPDRPVADYWPEFAVAGKDDVLVRHVVSHRAGLPALRAVLATDDVLDDRAMARTLAQQEPFWQAPRPLCYHALTYGWLCGELLRRVDGRSIGAFLSEEICGPLALDLWIGLPAQHEARVSRLRRTPDVPATPLPITPGCEEINRLIDDNPPLFGDDPAPWNSRAFHAAEIAGAGAIGTARAVARLYGCLANGGELDGVRLLRPETIALGRRELARGEDACVGVPLAFGFGVALQTPERTLGPPQDAFGHRGYGGSAHGCWPSLEVGFSYAMNDLQDNTRRADALLEALAEAVALSI